MEGSVELIYLLKIYKDVKKLTIVKGRENGKNREKMKFMKNLLKNRKGFTLIEILVVIGIIAILAAVVLIAINPARQFKQAHDSQRTSNVNSILNAIGQRIADNKGIFKGDIAGTTVVETCADLTTLTVDVPHSILDNTDAVVAGASVGLKCLAPTYIPALPSDPTTAATPDTGYDLKVDANGRMTVSAVGEITPSIAVTR